MYFLPIDVRRTFVVDLDQSKLGGLLLLAAAITVSSVVDPQEIQGQREVLELEQAAQAAVAAPTLAADVAPQVQRVFKTKDFMGEIPVEYIETNDLPPGMSKAIEEGDSGLYRQVYEVTSTTGEGQLIYTYPIKYPVTQVVMRNSQPIIGERFNLDKLTITRDFIVEATAYTHTGYRTASGVYPRYGLIATDPRVIPLGTKVYVEGYGYAVAADTGGAIKGDRIDVFFDTESRCLRWGRRNVRIFVLGEV